MARSLGGRVLAFAYVAPVTATVGALVLLGFFVDRVPLLPPSVGRGYERALFAAVGYLARPVDGLACRPTDRVAGRESVEPAR